MARPSKSDLLGLDFAYDGLPYLDVSTVSSVADDQAMDAVALLPAPSGASIISKALTATTSATASVADMISRLRSLSALCSGTAQRSKKVARLATRAVVGSAEMARTAYYLRAQLAISDGAVSVVRLRVAQRSIAAVSTALASLQRWLAMVRLSAAPGEATLWRRLSMARAVSVTGAATLATLSDIRRTVVAVASGAASIRRMVGRALMVVTVVAAYRLRRMPWSRQASSTGAATRAMRRPFVLVVLSSAIALGLSRKTAKIAAVAAGGLATVRRYLRIRRSVIALPVPSAQRLAVRMRSLLAVAGHVATLRRKLGRVRSTTAAGLAAIHHNIKRLMLALLAGVASFRRWMQQSVKAQADALPVMVRTRFRALAATASGLAGLVGNRAVAGWLRFKVGIREAVALSVQVKNAIRRIGVKD